MKPLTMPRWTIYVLQRDGTKRILCRLFGAQFKSLGNWVSYGLREGVGWASYGLREGAVEVVYEPHWKVGTR